MNPVGATGRAAFSPNPSANLVSVESCFFDVCFATEKVKRFFIALAISQAHVFLFPCAADVANRTVRERRGRMIKVAVCGLGRTGSEVIRAIRDSDRFSLTAAFCRPGSEKAG